MSKYLRETARGRRDLFRLTVSVQSISTRSYTLSRASWQLECMVENLLHGGRETERKGRTEGIRVRELLGYTPNDLTPPIRQSTAHKTHARDHFLQSGLSTISPPSKSLFRFWVHLHIELSIKSEPSRCSHFWSIPPPHPPDRHTQRCVFTNRLGSPLSNQIDNEDQSSQMVNYNTLRSLKCLIV